MRIATRLFLYLFTLVVFAAAVLGYVSVRDERHHLFQEARSRAWLLARALASVVRYYHPLDPTVDLEHVLAEIAFEGPSAPSLRFYDREGNRLDLACPECSDPPLPNRTLDPGALGRWGREEILQVGPQRYLSVVQPVTDPEGGFDGAVEVILPLRHIGRALSGVTRRFLLFTAAVAALLGVVIYLISRVNIALPIRRLVEGARKLGEGDLSLRLEKTGVVDLDELIDEFNRMAERLEDQARRREEEYQEKLRLERGLRHAEKLASVGQLTSGLAHELGTPLNVIQGRAEQLLARLPADDRARPGLEAIVRQARRITETIEALLAFSRKPDRGIRPVSLRALAEEAFALARLRVRRGREGVDLELSGTADAFVGDPDALRQMFVNLMLNSLQAMGGRGRIRVRTEPLEGGGVRIAYEDTGPGIPEELRPRVFDPFFTTKDVGEGTGLGLYIVASIVEEHGGGVTVEAAPGGGARFVITLAGPGEEE